MNHRSGWLVLVGLAACGGRVLESPYQEAGGASAVPEQAGSVAGAAGTAGRADPSKPLPTHSLSPCFPGFDRDEFPQRACNWSDAKGACYEEMDAACACVCPLNKDSLCWSSFPSPNQAVPVYCE